MSETGLKDFIAAAEKLEARISKAEKKFDEQREAAIAGGGFKPVNSAAGSSDEQKALRYFGCSSVKQLIETNVCDPRFNWVPQDIKGMVLSLKADIDIARMTQQICFGEPMDRVGKSDKQDMIPAHVKGVLDGNYYGKNVLAPKLKAFGTGVATEGAEWVPTAISSQFIEEFELERQVATLVRSMPMPTNPFQLPVQENVTKARIQAESGTISSANFNTDSIEFDATKLAEFTVLPEELNEDSAPAILALARREVVEAQGRAIEDSMLNGDDTATMDSDIGGATDNRRAWKGYRKLAIDNSATQDFTNAAVSLVNARAMRTAMGKFGVNVRQLAWIASPKIYNQMLGLDEVTTVEKFGQQATILQGALAALDGIPITISEFARDDLNASGVHDGVTVDRSVLYLVNHTRFMLGVRRPIRVRATMNPTPPNDEWMLVSWWRGDFEGHEQDAGETSTILGINIA